jgi:hypothetical protein
MRMGAGHGADRFCLMMAMRMLLFRLEMRRRLLRSLRRLLGGAGDRQKYCEDQGQGMHRGHANNLMTDSVDPINYRWISSKTA